MITYAYLDDVLEFQFRKYVEARGCLTPITTKEDVPFDIKRVFYAWNVPDMETRGHHAHYECHQVLICLQGNIEVTTTDGINERMFTLDSPEKALFVPASIWSEELYNNNAILLVLCSQEYSCDDYITDFDTYKNWRFENNGQE